jgi:hypothetical protein
LKAVLVLLSIRWSYYSYYLFKNILPDGYFYAKIILVSHKLNRSGVKKSVVETHVDRPLSGRYPLTAPPPGNLPSAAAPWLSHDIRAQLYIIIGFAELMLQEIPGKINDEQRRNLNDVLNSGRRLLELLHDIVSEPAGK